MIRKSKRNQINNQNLKVINKTQKIDVDIENE
jgi:hypothetical protein